MPLIDPCQFAVLMHQRCNSCRKAIHFCRELRPRSSVISPQTKFRLVGVDALIDPCQSHRNPKFNRVGDTPCGVPNTQQNDPSVTASPCHLPLSGEALTNIPPQNEIHFCRELRPRSSVIPHQTKFPAKRKRDEA